MPTKHKLEHTMVNPNLPSALKNTQVLHTGVFSFWSNCKPKLYKKIKNYQFCNSTHNKKALRLYTNEYKLLNFAQVFRFLKENSSAEVITDSPLTSTAGSPQFFHFAMKN